MQRKSIVLAALALCSAALPLTASATQRCYKQGIYTYCYSDGTVGGIRGNTDEPPSTDKAVRPNVVELGPSSRGPWLEIIGKMKESGNTKAAAEIQSNYDKTFPK